MRLTALLLLATALAVQARPDMPPAHDSVQTTAWFPKHARKAFPAGQLAEVVVGFNNGAAEAVNVSAVMGSLNSPFDFSLHVQNFTHQVYDIRLPPGVEVSLEYTFMPHAALQPREFALALTVYYHTDKQLYSNTFFNATVDITEPQSFVDSQLLFLYLLMLAAVAAVAYWAFTWLLTLEFFKRMSKRSRKVEVKKSSTETNADEWLKGTAYDQMQKSKSKKAALRKGD